MIGRRGALGMLGMGGLPGRRLDQAYRPPGGAMPPGGRLPVLARLLRIFGSSTNGSSGLFVYSGTPGNGDLIASIAAAAGVDPYNNPYQVDITSYATGSRFAQLAFAQLLLNPGVSGFASLPSAGASTGVGGAALELSSGQKNGADGVAVLTLFDADASSQAVPAAVLATSFQQPLTTALLEVQGNIETTGLGSIFASGDVQALLGNLRTEAAGSGLTIKEGANAKLGNATLVAGSVVVANTSVTANSGIFPGFRTPSANAGALFVSSVTPGTGFTIKSTNAADTSGIKYLIVDPS